MEDKSETGVWEETSWDRNAHAASSIDATRQLTGLSR
jgi:hypothetical protein